MVDVVAGPGTGWHAHGGGAGTVAAVVARHGCDVVCVGWVRPGAFAAGLPGLLPGAQEAAGLQGTGAAFAGLTRWWRRTSHGLVLDHRDDSIRFSVDAGHVTELFRARLRPLLADLRALVISDFLKLPGGIDCPRLVAPLVEAVPCVISAKRVVRGVPGAVLVVSDEDLGLGELDDDAITDLVGHLARAGWQRTVVTRAAFGVARSDGGRVRLFRDRPQPPGYSIGAGGVLSGTIGAALTNGRDFGEAVVEGCATATSSVSVRCIGFADCDRPVPLLWAIR
ncbi:hypothetical protein A6A25_33205 [Saccharothrix sp. CB00851]|nr:hypothetical protein A6A25_33205 [Saccharothrix sp. CB00851]